MYEVYRGDTMIDMSLNWKVNPILEAHNLTPYRLMMESGLSRSVTYGIANNTHPALDAGVVEKLIPALRRLTKNGALQIGDIVEYKETCVTC
jgi:hypothetical protein